MPVYINWLLVLFYSCLSGYAVWTWITWLRLRDKADARWRAIIVAGLCCATVSTALDVFLYVHAVLTGGYFSFDPVQLIYLRIGILTAALGLAIAFKAKGKLAGHVAVISALNLLIWLLDAISI
jgi:hypothetical protein